jgi:N6-L-threonylcarbamoyladenine synthase
VSSGLILGIETSCDETAAAVVADGRVVLSNVIASQAELHARYGGVFPEVASRQHLLAIVPTVEAALVESGAGWADLAAIAVTRGPGLAGSLLVGVNAAKGLAMARGLPLVGVNHLEGHLYSNWLHSGGRVRSPELAAAAAGEDPPFPHLALIVSGGHTDLLLVAGHGDYTLLGRTLDDAAGEAFDKVARLLGLGYPGGPELERLAESGDAGRFDFPVATTANPLDFSFSGLKSACRRALEESTVGGAPARLADLAASFQSAVLRALVGRVQRALAEYPVPMVMLAGGVSANGALRRALTEALDVPLRYPPLVLCTDNAAMIAAAGYWAWPAGRRDAWDVEVAPGLGFDTG